jgi:hypothetical protein
LEYLVDILNVFLTREWKFDNSNTRKLWSSLSTDDRKTFYFSFEGFNWNSYITSYFYGIRKHILKEDLNNNKMALARNRRYGLKKLWLFIFYLFYNYIYCFQTFLVPSFDYCSYYLFCFPNMPDFNETIIFKKISFMNTNLSNYCYLWVMEVYSVVEIPESYVLVSFRHRRHNILYINI